MSNAGILVVGAGLAGATVLTTLRDGGYDGPLALVGDEGEAPYERPGLSKDVLQGSAQADSLYVHPPGWYREHGVATHLNDAAVALDLAGRRVRLASGVELAYADLVLATGARPRVPPIEGVRLPGVHTLRRIGDSLALRAAFGPGRRVVVVGAGWIGLEVAAAARLAGAEVTVLEYADVPLRAAMGPLLGDVFARLHRRHGVELRTGVTVEAILGEDRVTGVRAGGQTVPADLVVIGVGAVPNAGLAADAGLAVDNGVLVDERLRTADPHVSAVGDLANAVWAGSGDRLRVEHWDNAIRQGRLAGQVLLGGDQRYDWQPYFYTDQFDLGMEYVGHGSADDEVVIRGETGDPDGGTGAFVVFWLRGGLITAAMNVNLWDVNDRLRALVGREATPDRLLAGPPFLGD